MRVGFVIYGSLDTISGGYLYDRELVAYLRAQGDSVKMYAQHWSGYGRRLFQNFSPTLPDALAAAEHDILLQDELNHPSLFFLNRRLRGGAPIVAVVHHLRCSEPRPAWQNRLYRAIERRYLAGVDGFIFNSATTRATVARLLPALPPHVVAYPAGSRFSAHPHLSSDDIGDRARAPGPLRVLFVGNLTPRKGLHTLLAALARLPDDCCRLTIVGSTAVDPAYVRRCRGLGSGRNVVWRGMLPDEALAAELAAHHVICVPSGYEGFGIVYLEGMAFGLPAIATTTGAARELVTDGQTGFLVTPDDPDGLAARLHQLSRDRDLLAALGRAARQRYANHPTWTETMSAVRTFLAALTRTHSAARPGAAQ